MDEEVGEFDDGGDDDDEVGEAVGIDEEVGDFVWDVGGYELGVFGVGCDVGFDGQSDVILS